MMQVFLTGLNPFSIQVNENEWRIEQHRAGGRESQSLLNSGQ